MAIIVTSKSAHRQDFGAACEETNATCWSIDAAGEQCRQCDHVLACMSMDVLAQFCNGHKQFMCSLSQAPPTQCVSLTCKRFVI